MQPYEAKMSAIEDRHPSLELPTDTFNEYEQLRSERNRLTVKGGVKTYQRGGAKLYH